MDFQSALSSAVFPLGAYGANKAAGEQAVEELLILSGQDIIQRTGWVMGQV